MSFKNQKISDDCPICGGKIWKPAHVIIEGAKVTVCQSCSRLGMKTIRSTPHKSQPTIAYKKPIKATTLKKPKEYGSQDRKDTGSNLKIIENYSNKIRNIRSKHKLTQREFALKLHEKESLIKSIESGKREPTIALAMKIEKTFGIKLTEKEEENGYVDARFLQNKKKPLTLGDMVVIKKKKKSND
jgi:uncharacterized protein (TIGR00270 family)